MQAHWRDDADHADPLTLIRIANAPRYCGDHLLDRAKDLEVFAVFRRNTENPSPAPFSDHLFIFVEGDMFYGQDRLEMIEHALASSDS